MRAGNQDFAGDVCLKFGFLFGISREKPIFADI